MFFSIFAGEFKFYLTDRDLWSDITDQSRLKRVPVVIYHVKKNIRLDTIA